MCNCSDGHFAVYGVTHTVVIIWDSITFGVYECSTFHPRRQTLLGLKCYWELTEEQK